MEIRDLPNGTTRSRAIWDDIKKEHFVEILLDHVSDRQKRSAWNTTNWLEITQQMGARFPESNFSTAQLKQLERDLKKIYKSIKHIELQPGFEWDATNHMLKASDDDWQKLFERDSTARKWHRKILPYYSELDTLYGGYNEAEKAKSNQEAYSFPDNLMKLASISCLEEGTAHVPNRINLNNSHKSGSCLDLCDSQDQYEQSEVQELHLLSTANTYSSSYKRPRLNDETMNKQNELFDKQASPGNNEFRVEKEIRNDFSISRCIAEYYQLQGFQTSDVLHVAEIFKDEQNRELFLALRKCERGFWLKANVDIRKQAIS
ncbi:hypothetical protein LUZ60_007944 [Juncus effusus]|nr:hypothetical protein LUZ60_007944 [Juncus effusus]